MKILVTGANGFVGRNLVCALENIRDGKDKTHPKLTIDAIDSYDVDTDPTLLDEYCKKADMVFHLAGVNRPEKEEEFMQGNFGFTSLLLDTLKKYQNKATVMVSSSIQAALDNPYGRSKKAGEDLMFAYGKETGASVCVYRLPNVFGKWCRPNYNSAVATFCHNIAHELPITVNNPSHEMTLVYIDDVVDALLSVMEGKETKEGDFCKVPVEHKITLGEIADLLYTFHDQPQTLVMPEIPDGSFAKKLYATYCLTCPKKRRSFP